MTPTTQARLQQARAHEAAGALEAARSGYGAIVAGEPPDAPAYALAAYRLGLVCRQLGRIGEALAWLQKGWQHSGHPDAAIDYAAALQAAGQWMAAAELFARALELAPGAPDALWGRAVSLHRLGQVDAAEAAYRAMLAGYPDLPAVYDNLGQLLAAAGRHDAALEVLAAGTRRCPAEPALWRQRLRVLGMIGRHADTVAAGRRAAALQPDDGAVLGLLAAGLEGSGALPTAAAAARRALRLAPTPYDPAMIAVAASLADIHRRLGEPEAALSILRLLLRHDPHCMAGWHTLGRLRMDLAEPSLAARAFRAAVAVDPADADRLLDLGSALVRCDDITGAASAYRRVLRLDPDSGLALGHWVEQQFKACAWDGLDPAIDRLLALVRDHGKAAPPFGFLSLPGATEADQRRVAERWAAWKLGRVAPVAQPRPAIADGRLRIGYLSSDFREHAISHLMAGVLEAHDRERFAVTAYSIGPDDGSALRRRVMVGAERFVDLRFTDDGAAAARIAGDGIDILVDVNAYTAFARTAIVAARPAPVQVNWLGYPGTMGAGFIDYILADAVVIPPGCEGSYSETVVRLPHSYQANDDKRPIADVVVTRTEAGLPPDGFVFCCFNNLHKITRPVFALWMALLHEVPGSVLWLLQGHPSAVANLRAAAAAAGHDPARLVFAPPLPPARHLARHRLADLFLDTLPYNAHTTASDALWAGLPLVTCRGDTFAGRVAASLLTAAGLPELIAETPADYTALALRLAGDPAALAATRARLAANRLHCPLFDTKAFTRDIEAAFMAMAREKAVLPSLAEAFTTGRGR